MNATTETPKEEIVYPESDGKPMADNTKQARWMVVLHGNLDSLFRDSQVFVAMDLMWYAKKGFPEECAAPDVFVAFGRPKGDRRSHKQWQEEDVAPQVVFEILSPNNTGPEMENKEAFYSDHGVEEYYVYDPEKDHLIVLLRKGTVLRYKWFQDEFVSPMLGIRFDLTGDEMQVFYPDGRRFLTFEEVEADRTLQKQLRIAAEQKLRAAEEKLVSTEEKLGATEEKLESTEEKLVSARQRMARLRELSRKARHGQATAEEIEELERLENDNGSLSS